MDVDFAGGRADGMTVIDVDGRDKSAGKNCFVAFNADREKLVSMVKTALARGEKN